jgi:hypothetical protein
MFSNGIGQDRIDSYFLIMVTPFIDTYHEISRQMRSKIGGKKKEKKKVGEI